MLVAGCNPDGHPHGEAHRHFLPRYIVPSQRDALSLLPVGVTVPLIHPLVVMIYSRDRCLAPLSPQPSALSPLPMGLWTACLTSHSGRRRRRGCRIGLCARVERCILPLACFITPCQSRNEMTSCGVMDGSLSGAKPFLGMSLTFCSAPGAFLKG